MKVFSHDIYGAKMKNTMRQLERQTVRANCSVRMPAPRPPSTAAKKNLRPIGGRASLVYGCWSGNYGIAHGLSNEISLCAQEYQRPCVLSVDTEDFLKLL
jgi:hypothetical protein